MTFREEQTVRIGLWVILQALFLICVFPDFASYGSDQQQIRACFAASCLALVSIVIIVPILTKVSRFVRAVLWLMLAFSVFILFSALRNLDYVI